MSHQVPELVIVFLCVLGAGAVVTACAAFGKTIFSSRNEPETNFYQRSAEQDSHQRRVREINQLAIWSQLRSQRREQRRQRERDASDIEIQSGRSYSNAGGHGGSRYSQHSGAYSSQWYSSHAPPVAYYEEHDYAEYTGSNTGYVQRPSSQSQQQGQDRRAYNNQYATNASKPGPAATWHEVSR